MDANRIKENRRKLENRIQSLYQKIDNKGQEIKNYTKKLAEMPSSQNSQRITARQEVFKQYRTPLRLNTPQRQKSQLSYIQTDESIGSLSIASKYKERNMEQRRIKSYANLANFTENSVSSGEKTFNFYNDNRYKNKSSNLSYRENKIQTQLRKQSPQIKYPKRNQNNDIQDFSNLRRQFKQDLILQEDLGQIESLIQQLLLKLKIFEENQRKNEKYELSLISKNQKLDHQIQEIQMIIQDQQEQLQIVEKLHLKIEQLEKDKQESIESFEYEKQMEQQDQSELKEFKVMFNVQMRKEDLQNIHQHQNIGEAMKRDISYKSQLIDQEFQLDSELQVIQDEIHQVDELERETVGMLDQRKLELDKQILSIQTEIAQVQSNIEAPSNYEQQSDLSLKETRIKQLTSQILEAEEKIQFQKYEEQSIKQKIQEALDQERKLQQEEFQFLKNYEYESRKLNKRFRELQFSNETYNQRIRSQNYIQPDQ